MSSSGYLSVRNQFNDFDALAEAISAWDLDFRQLDRGQSRAELSQLVGTEVIFSHARFSRHYHQQGATPPGMRTFALSEDDVSGFNWFGRDVTASSLMCFPVSGILEAVTRPGFEVYTISFSEKLLHKMSNSLGLPDLDTILSNQDKLAFCDPHVIRGIRDQFRKIRNYFRKEIKVPSEAEVIHVLECELPARILSALNGSSELTKLKPTQWKKQHALKKAKDFINTFCNEPLSVSSICRHVDVSLRTLENAFKEYYGVTPKHYLKVTRLNGVHKELNDRQLPSTSITDIANYWGFWHMGQFAKDYRNLFNELPSETARQRT